MTAILTAIRGDMTGVCAKASGPGARSIRWSRQRIADGLKGAITCSRFEVQAQAAGTTSQVQAGVTNE